MKDDAKQKLTPRLRFPEFRDNWDTAPLAEIADFINEKTPVSKIALADYVSTENLLPDFDGFTSASKLPPTGAVTRYQPGDVLISNIRPYLKKIWQADRGGGASNDVIVVRSRDQVSRDYLSLILKNDAFVAYVMDSAKGLKMPRGDVESMREYPVTYPSPAEQQKIADCLTSLDKLVAAQGRKVEALAARKKGLMQQLFPREGETLPRLRFPEFRNAGEWTTRTIGEVLIKQAEPAVLNDDDVYREIGIRSHGKGLFHKDGVTGKSLGTKRVFHVVPDALVINIVFAWEQAIAVTTKDEIGFIASHRFPMFVPRENRCDVAFVQRLFLMPTGKQLLKIASPGGAGRNRTLSQKEFENLKVLLPTTAEQQRIADCLGVLDAAIAAETDRLAALKTHKKGLMQQLFPATEAPLTHEMTSEAHS